MAQSIVKAARAYLAAATEIERAGLRPELEEGYRLC